MGGWFDGKIETFVNEISDKKIFISMQLQLDKFKEERHVRACSIDSLFW